MRNTYDTSRCEYYFFKNEAKALPHLINKEEENARLINGKPGENRHKHPCQPSWNTTALREHIANLATNTSRTHTTKESRHQDCPLGSSSLLLEPETPTSPKNHNQI